MKSEEIYAMHKTTLSCRARVYRDAVRNCPDAVFGKQSPYKLPASLLTSLAISLLFTNTSTATVEHPLQAFDYSGVTLLESRFQEQFQSARDYYLAVSNDDILNGYRKQANLPAPGKPLGGWCAHDSNIVFGQWLSGMARIYKATGDQELLNKATYLLSEWVKTMGENGDCHMDLYEYDKLVCGLVDLHLYADQPTLPLLRKTLNWAMTSFSRERQLETPYLTSGEPGEWYTLAENLYRANELLQDPKVEAFAESYCHPDFWGKFVETDSPEDAHNLHAYSHVNSFSSLAKQYEHSGDQQWLSALVNSYDFMQEHQCFATGGYGPMERILPMDGTLGKSVEARNASFETVCGSWAGFKMCRYLQEFTGEARFGDWMERLLYNGVGAALPIKEGGEHFYYSDYRVSGGMKVYKVSRYSCCSGTYIQCVADYHNLIYYHSEDGIFVNLYVPSKLEWKHSGVSITLTQTTDYPATDTSEFKIDLNGAGSQAFNLSFRTPQWCKGLRLTVNGEPIADKNIQQQNGWAILNRVWSSGDQVTVQIPMQPKMQPIDAQHPRRVAITNGPVTLAMQDWVFEEIPSLPEPEALSTWLIPDEAHAGAFKIAPQRGKTYNARFLPFYEYGEVIPYRIYFDLDAAPIPVWGMEHIDDVE